MTYMTVSQAPFLLWPKSINEFDFIVTLFNTEVRSKASVSVVVVFNQPHSTKTLTMSLLSQNTKEWRKRKQSP